MHPLEDQQRSILIVSASETFDAQAKKALLGAPLVDVRRRCSVARRCVLERYYDLIIINAPLPDESGEQFAMDITEQCHASVLLLVPSEVYEDVLDHVTDQGILVLAKPLQEGRMNKAIRFLFAMRRRLKEMEKRVLTVEEKMEELRIVNKAKFLLVEKRRMTEDDAHRFIGKLAMNAGVSRKRAAEQVVEEFGE